MKSTANTPKRKIQVQQFVFAILVFALALQAFFAPLRTVPVGSYIGVPLLLSGVLLILQGFRRAYNQERRSAWFSGFITLLIAFLYINADYLRGTALMKIAALLFGIDGMYQLFLVLRNRKMSRPWVRPALMFAGNMLVMIGIFMVKGKSVEWMVSIAGALRIAGMGFDILSSTVGDTKGLSEDVLTSMSLQGDEELKKIAARIYHSVDERATADRKWIITFVIVLFFIHLGRMGFDRSASGMLSPMIALIGDLVVALIIAFFIVAPLRSVFAIATRPLETAIWKWVMKVAEANRKWYSLRSLIQWSLEARLALRIRMRKAGYSLMTAVRTGLQIGLPFSALLAAIIPVFGMSWYFDTENWAAGIWDSWAAARTDVWRKAMINAVEPNPTAASFTLKPEGVNDKGDFSFVVLGDPGEGDASQYSLHDQVVEVMQRPEVKFMVISTDVVYPDGAMKDYEKNFWLPMLGVHKPVYAIPGNHDWYDALDAFNATFLDSASASKSMHARREADLKITSTTASKIDELIEKAAWYRNEYRVPTGLQQAPVFQIQTKDFAFITIETGVLRRIDDAQMKWVKQALEAAKGKFIFVLLGHPFYATGEYMGSLNPDFEALHQLLRQYHARIAMAGDTHDLEYYEEPLKGADSGKTMYHFVNGGGGAYLSIGAALKPKDQIPEKVWAHYPATVPLVDKIEKNNNMLRRPAWKWTKIYNGWPFSAEWLSAAFDYNVAPFFQSFFEIRVEPSKNQVRLLPYTVHGPLTWADMDISSGVKPDSAAMTTPVQWVFPLK